MNKAETNLSPPLARRTMFAIGLGITTIVTTIDLATKWYIAEVVMDPPRVISITPFFNLGLWFNRGVSFGFLGDLGDRGPVILSLVAVCVIAFLVLWLWRTESRIERVSLSIIIGGAIANVIDRLRDGAVTDFLDFYAGSYHWPAFNLADVGICTGAGLLILSSFITRKDRRT